jgi:hypothetical protein
MLKVIVISFSLGVFEGIILADWYAARRLANKLVKSGSQGFKKAQKA